MNDGNIWTVEGWSKVKGIISDSAYDYREDFVLWLGENPHIWHSFAKKTLEANSFKHKQRFSARTIIELLRWETMLQEEGAAFKINNTYCADLSRLLMDCKPELKGYFQIRGSTIRHDASPLILNGSSSNVERVLK